MKQTALKGFEHHTYNICDNCNKKHYHSHTHIAKDRNICYSCYCDLKDYLYN